MAKSKFVKTVKEVLKNEPVKIEPVKIPDPITEKAKVKLDSIKEPKTIIVKEEETQTVIGIASAEGLQKSGWQLIDCHLTPNGKEYKFRKVN